MRFSFHNLSTTVANVFLDFLLLTSLWVTASQRQTEPARGLVVSRCRIPTKLPVFPLRCSVYTRKQGCKYPTWMLWNQGKRKQKLLLCWCLFFCFDEFLNLSVLLFHCIPRGVCKNSTWLCWGNFKRKLKKKKKKKGSSFSSSWT